MQRAVLGCADLLSQRITGKLKYCDILEAALAKERDSLQVRFTLGAGHVLLDMA